MEGENLTPKGRGAMRLTMAEAARYYLSLGDSISIDAYAGGPGRGGASLLYRNRDDDFPEWRGRDLASQRPGTRLLPLAMDGATSATVRYYQLPRLSEMGVVPDLVTLTMGGNDLVQCWLNDIAARDANRALLQHGAAILTALRRTMGKDAPILVGTIYDPSDGTGNGSGLDLMQWPTALEWLRSFNESLRSLAKTYDARTADIHATFLGHGLTVGDPTQSDSHPANRNLWYCGTIEPNAWGASALRALWWETLVASGFLAPEVP
ncbi:MAG: SGNH/GDSL hydrolase family protein [Capsulimonadales bacterium]|nr:SGNH/GDSL hydrolase family protein [Capsulimonadales bacterium]